MIKLTNKKKWKDEPILDYINHWRALSLKCKDRLFKTFVVEICTQGMVWDLLTNEQAPNFSRAGDDVSPVDNSLKFKPV